MRREFLGNDRAVAGERERLVAQPRAHGDEPAEGVLVPRDVDLDALVVVIVRCPGDPRDGIVGKDPGATALGVSGHAIGHGIALRVGGIGVHAHGHVVVVELAELLVDDVVDGVLEPQAREQQRRAAGDADDSHAQAALVAEQVARRDLPAEGHPAPHRPHALEQDTLAGLRGAREHELGGLLAQGRGHGSPGRDHRDAHAEPRRRERDARIDGHGPARQRIDDGVRAHDEPRQEDRENHDAEGRPDAARDGSVQQVLRRDLGLRVTERLVRADEHAVLVDHARHGGERDERRHEEEDQGEHLGDLVDTARVGAEALGADVLGEVEGVDGGVPGGDVVHLRLCVGELDLGVGKLALHLGALGGELLGADPPLRKAVVVLGLARGQLCLSVGELSATFVKARCGGVELGLGVGEALLCGGLLGGELGGGRVKPLGHTGDLRVDLGDGVVELLDAGLGRGLLSLKVRLLRLERRKGCLGFGKLLLADGLLRLERGLLLRVPLSHRVERVERGLELRDRRGKRVDARLGLGDAGLDLGDSVLELP